MQCLEPDGRGVGACDRLSTARWLFPAPSHVPAFVRKEGRKLSKECVLAPCSVIRGASALGCCCTSSRQSIFLIKLKCLSTAAPGPAAGRGDSGSLG